MSRDAPSLRPSEHPAPAPSHRVSGVTPLLDWAKGPGVQEDRVVTYRIRDWDLHFENNRTRELKRMAWVPLPNKQDGDGYTELLDHPQGAAHLGAWVAIVQIASKCDPRGTLLRDSAAPHCEESIARISRIPKAVIKAAIPRLIKIGWLETYGIPQEGAGISHPAAIEQKGMEGKGTEGKDPPTPQGGGDVDRIIAHYQTWHPKARPGDKDRKLIAARLKEGHSPEDLTQAIDGCHNSPFHCGVNERGAKYLSLSLIMRDSAHVQQFLEVPTNGHPVLNEKNRRTMLAMQRFVDGTDE